MQKMIALSIISLLFAGCNSPTEATQNEKTKQYYNGSATAVILLDKDGKLRTITTATMKRAEGVTYWKDERGMLSTMTGNTNSTGGVKSIDFKVLGEWTRFEVGEGKQKRISLVRSDRVIEIVQ